MNSVSTCHADLFIPRVEKSHMNSVSIYECFFYCAMLTSFLLSRVHQVILPLTALSPPLSHPTATSNDNLPVVSLPTLPNRRCSKFQPSPRNIIRASRRT
jgi:hypothetical protein